MSYSLRPLWEHLCPTYLPQEPCLSSLAHSKLFPAPFPSPSRVSLIHSLFNFTYHFHLFQKVLPHRVQSSSLVFGALPSLHFPPRAGPQPQFRSTAGVSEHLPLSPADSVNHHLHPPPQLCGSGCYLGSAPCFLTHRWGLSLTSHRLLIRRIHEMGGGF